MPAIIRSAGRGAVAVVALAAFGLIAPQASAAESPAVSGVAVSPRADSATRAIAAANPETVRAAASLCGSSYRLYNAERLPDERRFGTLFTYDNGGLGPRNYACAVFDNNLGSTKYMKLKLCENRISHPRCDVDAGYFSQYAGPVYMNNCATTTAIMKNTKSSRVALIDAVRGSFCN